MSNALGLLFIAILVYAAGAAASLAFAKQEKLAIYSTGIAGVIAGLIGLLAVSGVLLGTEPVAVASFEGPFVFAPFVVRLDMLAAFMIAVISLLAIIVSVYSFSYVQEYIGKGAWAIGFFMNVFIASMIGLMVMDNAFYFIIFFELMSLASYFLVISDQSEEAIKAGFLYFLIAHIGSMLIMAAFFVMYCFTETGSLNFADFRLAELSPLMSSIVFLLAFFGFGAKAGMLPLHGWLPRAHPAAPSHASAMMSGVMVKIGVFGIIKVGVDLLGASQMWWGILVLVFGAVSAVLGILYALAERDIKRLLAYCTVENVGIILMGVGVGMVGMSLQTPAGNLLAALGFLGALYHLLNHAIYKGLLFLGAGAIIFRVHTKDMEKMGGLGRLMPLTAMAFLVGCMAISALPPLNGFVSEWYTFQSLFKMSLEGSSTVMRLAGPIGIVMLAITGAFAAMCFVKVFGIIFSGNARDEKTKQAREVPASMTGSMLALAAICIVLGVGAAQVAPIITNVANALTQSNDVLVAVQGQALVPDAALATSLSPVLVSILMVGAFTLPVLIYLATRAHRLPFRRREEPWACGYMYEDAMAQSADSFTQPLRFMFSGLYRVRETLSPSAHLHAALDKTTAAARKVEPMWDDGLVARVVKAVQWCGEKLQCIQHGDFRVYCIYIVIALVALLATVAF